MRSDTNPRSPACNSKDERGMTKKLPPANQIESAPRVKLAVASRWLMTGASHAVFLETSVYSEAQEK